MCLNIMMLLQSVSAVPVIQVWMFVAGGWRPGWKGSAWSGQRSAGSSASGDSSLLSSSCSF